MRSLTACLLTILFLGMPSGCDTPPATTSSTSSSSSSAPPPPPAGATDVGGANVVHEDEENEPLPENETEDGYQREVAKTGAGKKGRNYGGGIISEPIRQRFRVEQQLQYQNVKRAVDLYKAEHGFFPKTQDEFMTKIIKANSIELPELPEGERYGYEPKTGQLMVEKPKPQ